MAIKEYSAKNDIEVDICIVDNSPKGHYFINMASNLCAEAGIDFTHLDFPGGIGQPIHHRIAESMNFIRDKMLAGDYGWLFILEADVIPTTDDGIVELIKYCDENEFEGAEGFYYYPFTPAGFEINRFWLTGYCIVRRTVMEQIRFRYDPIVPGALPDAFLGCDMDSLGMKYGIHPTLQAEHYDSPLIGGRGWPIINEKLYK